MTQYLPPDDDFAEGSPAYGSAGVGFLPLYICARPTTSAINTIWTPTGFGIKSRQIHGGYQATNPQTGQIDYNAAFYNNGTGAAADAAARQPSAMAFRAAFAADVEVSGTFEMRSLAGTLNLAQMAPRGVFARYQGGTLGNDGASNPEIAGGSCYMAALYQKNSDSSLRFSIIKFVSGTPTVIAESTAIATSLVDFSALQTITLNVSGTGLFATITTPSGTLRVPTSGTVTDSSVTGVGRCGFMMGADREPVAGRRQVDLCHLFRVVEGSTLKLQDEFQRLSLAAAKTSPADITGVVGGYLSSAFYWDVATYDGSYSAGGKAYSGARRLRRNATSNRVEMNHDTTDDDVNAGRLLLSQRPADSIFSQHRSVKVIVPSAAALSTGEVWAGIILRGRQAMPLDENPPTVAVGGAGPNFCGNGTANTAGTGYMFVLRARQSTQVTWQIHRIQNNAHFPVCLLTENSPFSIFPGYGSQFTMDFDVYPRNPADPYGPVEMVCKVDGNLLDMALTTAATNNGMLNPSTGVFVDNTSARVKSNRGEGLVAVNGFFRSGSASANIDPVFEAWTQGSLTNLTVIDQDQLSVTVLGEGSAAGTALDTLIDPSELSITYQGFSVSAPFESGHRGTVPRFVRKSTGEVVLRQIMRFRREGAREAQLVDVLNHFHAHDGVEIPFNYTPPGGTTTKVHYLSDRIHHVMTGVDAYTIEFDLESLE